MQAHRTGEYTPRPQSVRHVHDTLQMMQVLTGDRRFERALAEGTEGREMTMIDMLSKIENRGVERGIAQGREQGLAQGRELGLVQGREQGLVQGRELGHADIARNMIADGVAPDLVLKYTGISLDRIGEMADEHDR